MTTVAVIRRNALRSLIPPPAIFGMDRGQHPPAGRFSTPAIGSRSAPFPPQPTASFADRPVVRFDARMRELTRRRDLNASQEAWQVFCGDVRAGEIAIDAAIRTAPIRGAGAAGFYPGSEPGECTPGTTATFEQAPGAPLRRS
ncbi:hypothetical protein IVB18_32025 [Bradyrhizobium sp. 186]|uniref:hypothetical protein n=1 Tax=Bradyrhizobium sp. 186 TaxID=2782654 RepID=UPI0020009637|nr:hypothetical protein [Bradyrhizobium sp. 186]UPK32853.1 hypothetical protein IVB18_32025 [Bradyrhizobium sp. 186]